MSPLTAATLAFALLGAAAFTLLLVVDAPYGRHARRGWGPRVPALTGWIAMEVPALVVFPATALTLGGVPDAAGRLFLAAWIVHYAYRSIVYPTVHGRRGTPLPVAIVASGALFNVVNGVLHGAWLAGPGAGRGAAWLTDPRCLAGLALFAAGFVLHARSDARLARLRRASGGGYGLPRGGAFELVSCPNYLGEIVQWTGWALMTWSLQGAVFAAWTAANLVPRALAHHRWYRERFEAYPGTRRAVLPWLL